MHNHGGIARWHYFLYICKLNNVEVFEIDLGNSNIYDEKFIAFVIFVNIEKDNIDVNSLTKNDIQKYKKKYKMGVYTK